MFKLDLENAEEPEINIHWITEKAREFQKKYTSPLLTTPKPLTGWITPTGRKFLKT